MHEKRLTTRLITYWERIRKDQPMPDFAKFNASAVDDIKEHCLVLAIQPGSDAVQTLYRYEYLGEKLGEVYGRDMLGQYTQSNMKDLPGMSIIKKADLLTSDNITVINDEGQFVNDNSKIVKYRSCLLPFGKNNKISHVVAGISWKIFG